MAEMVIGLDPHKASNTIAVLDRDETVHAARRFDNSGDGLVAMLAAVAEFDDRLWAVEGANGIGRSIAQRLVAAGEVVVDVPAKLATRVRVYSTGHGTKTRPTRWRWPGRRCIAATFGWWTRRRERGVEVAVGSPSRTDRREDPVVSASPSGA